MFSEAKVIEIYCLADDFCKEFAKYQENHMLSTVMVVKYMELAESLVL